MLDHVKEALKFIEKAFGSPVYLGKRPQAAFTEGSAPNRVATWPTSESKS